jgi:hypothetical protein
LLTARKFAIRKRGYLLGMTGTEFRNERSDDGLIVACSDLDGLAHLHFVASISNALFSALFAVNCLARNSEEID